MDLLALATMKNAANGETSCDLHALRIIKSLNASCTCGPAAQVCLFEYREHHHAHGDAGVDLGVMGGQIDRMGTRAHHHLPSKAARSR